MQNQIETEEGSLNAQPGLLILIRTSWQADFRETWRRLGSSSRSAYHKYEFVIGRPQEGSRANRCTCNDSSSVVSGSFSIEFQLKSIDSGSFQTSSSEWMVLNRISLEKHWFWLGRASRSEIVRLQWNFCWKSLSVAQSFLQLRIGPFSIECLLKRIDYGIVTLPAQNGTSLILANWSLQLRIWFVCYRFYNEMYSFWCNRPSTSESDRFTIIYETYQF